MHSNGNKSLKWKEILKPRCSIIRSTVLAFMCSMCSKHSYFSSNMLQITALCYWDDEAIWRDVGIIYHLHFQHWNKMHSNFLSTAPGCSLKPSVTIIWSKAEHMYSHENILGTSSTARKARCICACPSSLVSCYRPGYGSPVLATE